MVSVRIGVIIENTEPMNSPGRLPCASISRSMSSGVRLRVQRLMNPNAEALLAGVGVEVDGRDREDEVLHRLGVERGVAGGEHPALADAEQVDLVDRRARSRMTSTHSSR